MGVRAIALFVGLFLGASLSWADVVELKTGQRVEGTFKQATPAGVVIEVGGQVITFDQEKVRAIYFGPAPGVQAQPSALGEAMKALKGLQSAVTGGVSYQDYALRTTDAKIIVDRYLEQPERGDAAQRAAIADAMRFYVLAASAWNAWIRSDFGGYSRVEKDHRAREQCPAATEAVGAGLLLMIKLGVALESPSFPRGTTSGLRSEGVPAFWSCAADKIADAERAMKAMPPGGK